MPQRYWLMKSEPDVYSIADLEEDGTTCWEGVRNYEARNNMQEMSEGELVLFYHSSTTPPGVAGVARVSREAYPDHYAFDPDHAYHDEKSDPDDPTWWMVDVEFVERFDEPVALSRIKDRDELREMVLVNRTRLSVQPVAEEEFELVRRMGKGVS
ncbi:MAG TPA: EVE domain-containing protein [Longimicrobiales bacterium]|nr:EVE domain-containing protein [Longimicrobiales bacterium]